MQAVVFLTHMESEPVYQHFLRLKAETRGLLDVYLAVHDCIGQLIQLPLPADFRIPADGIGHVEFSARYAEKKARGGSFVPGFVDLICVPIMLGPELAGYSSIWLLEYDVDFAGPWDAFFRPLLSSPADLIGADLYPKDQCRDWYFWPEIATPAQVAPENYIRGFFPVTRFSRRMIEVYSKAIQSGSWRGHFEALCPTIAQHHSLLIEDLGGRGPFTPTALLHKNYISWIDGLEGGTFVYRPVRQTSYYYVAPQHFPRAGYLYHPVKANLGTAALLGSPAYKVRLSLG